MRGEWSVGGRGKGEGVMELLKGATVKVPSVAGGRGRFTDEHGKVRQKEAEGMGEGRVGSEIFGGGNE